MPESRGTLTGPDRFVTLAGALAEAGVLRLVVESPGGGRTELPARVTDLPALLAQTAPGSVLSTPDGSIRVALEPTELAWECAGEPAGHSSELLASILAAR